MRKLIFVTAAALSLAAAAPAFADSMVRDGGPVDTPKAQLFDSGSSFQALYEGRSASDQGATRGGDGEAPSHNGNATFYGIGH
jgi:hypothetical protein